MTLVYELARLRNDRGQVFPASMLEMPSTAERFPSLEAASYEVLDDVVQRYVEYGEGLADIVAAGHDADMVESLLRRIADAELIRRYAHPG